KAAALASLVDDNTIALAHTVASEISILSDSFILRESDVTDTSNKLTQDLKTLGLESEASTSDPQASSPSTLRLDPSLPTYIEPAYKWLLKHLHNPYPKKEIKQRLADEADSTIERISDWFVDVRRRITWTIVLREEFGRNRNDMVDAATRFFRNTPLPEDVHGRFVMIEVLARELYSHKFVASGLSNKLTSAVKDLTPARQEKVRDDRVRQVRAAKQAAKLGIYPSPPHSNRSSPVLDVGRKRAFSETSDGAYFDSRKRSRTDDAYALPSPPSSGASSPNTRKRRLSDDDAPSAKRARTNRSASDPTPVTVTFSGNPDLLADWFSSEPEATPDLFDPAQQLDIQLFNRADYELPEEEPAAYPAQYITQTSSLPPPPPPEPEDFNITLPAEYANAFDIHIPSEPWDQSLTSYDSMSLFNNLIEIHQPAESYLEPFSGRGDSYISRQSVAESFGFEPTTSYETPVAYSAMGKASGHFINDLLDQQHQHQNQKFDEYAFYPSAASY
ncbi:Homeodomain 1, partial [Favolaschia claudopus]